MTQARFSCNAVDVFDLAGLPDWIRRERQAGRMPLDGDVSLDVIHPDREMDGSCRWCGCRQNEVILFEKARLE